MTYEKAYLKLQQIITDLESGEIPLNKLPAAIKQAGELINFCKDQLRGIESELSAINSSEEE